MRPASDEDLRARCLAGDEAAFAELVDRYKHLVYGVVSQVISDAGRVDDLAQEVFVRVYRGLPRFRGDAKLSTWIYRIVRNVCAEAAASRRPMVSLDERDPEGRLRHEPSAHDAAFGLIELRDRLEKAVAALPVAERFMIAAHYFGGLSYQELAAVLDMPMGTVKTHLHRAKGRLRVLLDDRVAHG